jgi:hypothetical protein
MPDFIQAGINKDAPQNNSQNEGSDGTSPMNTILNDCPWSVGALKEQKFQITNIKYQTNHNDQNSKFQTCFGH